MFKKVWNMITNRNNKYKDLIENMIDELFYSHSMIDEYNDLKSLLKNNQLEQFKDKFELYSNDIFIKIMNLEYSNKKLDIKKKHTIIVPNKRKIDTSKFRTEKYLSEFNNIQVNEQDDKNLLVEYAKLLYKENLYLEGLLRCINYCNSEKIRGVSIESQLKTFLLTDTGREFVKKEIIKNNKGE